MHWFDVKVQLCSNCSSNLAMLVTASKFKIYNYSLLSLSLIKNCILNICSFNDRLQTTNIFTNIII